MILAGSPFSAALRSAAFLLAMSVAAALALTLPARAAPEAVHLMDVRSGETLYERNANTPLHPASLTKMLTLYIAFEEIQRGNLTLDSLITVSKNAAAQPPSRLGLKAGQKIQLRFLIRAAAIRSANDAAQAIGDAIGGNQAEFGKRMTRTARALGMRNSTFKNASGLTAKGHLSTAYDMSILGRRLFYDFPQYYNIFSRRETDAGLAEVANTNRRFLDGYKGADGIKTGYTGAAGFNLTASAERGNVRLIGTVFGGTSTADRNAKMAKLLDRGFAMARGDVNAVPPPPPHYEAADNEAIATLRPEDGLPEGGEGASAKTVRAIMTVKTSPRPMPRPDMAELAEDAQLAVAEMADGIAGALAEVAQTMGADGMPLPFAVAAPEDLAALAPEAAPEAVPAQLAAADDAPAKAIAPMARPARVSGGGNAQEAVAALDPEAPKTGAEALAPAADEQALAAPIITAPTAPVPASASASASAPVPATALAAKRNAPIYDIADVVQASSAGQAGLVTVAMAQNAGTEVVTRLSTSGSRHWGVNVGRFASSDAAQRILVKTQLVESATLGQSLRKVTQKGGGFDANFLGLSEADAALVCRRLSARAIPCIPLGP